MNFHWKQDLKQEIKKAFKAQAPQRQKKENFIRSLPKSRISTWQFMLTQVTYLRKRALALSLLLLFPAIQGAYVIQQNTLWIVSSFIPFLGLLAVTECTRSPVYGMEEFEMSTRFSLKNVMLARMSILGMLDFLELICLAPLCCIGNQISLLQTGVYLLVPYLLTLNISLWLTRCIRGKDALYGCVSAAVLVSAANWGLHFIADFIYQFSYIHWWVILAVLLIVRMAQEIYHIIKKTEDFVWN